VGHSSISSVATNTRDLCYEDGDTLVGVGDWRYAMRWPGEWIKLKNRWPVVS